MNGRTAVRDNERAIMIRRTAVRPNQRAKTNGRTAVRHNKQVPLFPFSHVP